MWSQWMFQVGFGLFLVAGSASWSLAANTAAAVSEKDMVLVPRGEFTMGSHEHADERAHQVVLDPYYIDKYEVSNARYKEFMKATGHPAPAYWDDPRLSTPEQPVVGVSWNDAAAFCRWEGKRCRPRRNGSGRLRDRKAITIIHGATRWIPRRRTMGRTSGARCRWIPIQRA